MVPGPTVNSDQLACNTVTAGNVQVVSPGSTFTADDSIVLQNLFFVPSGVSFTAVVDPFVDSPFAFVRDDSPGAVTSYWAAFDLNSDSLTLGIGDDIGLFNGYAANGDLLFRAVLRWNTSLSENRLALFAWDDTAGALRESIGDFLLPAGYNAVQFLWEAGAGSGQFLASINGSTLAGLSDLDNRSRSIDSVRLGAVDGTVASSTGSMDLDNFESWLLAEPASETTIVPSNVVNDGSTLFTTPTVFGRSLAIDGDTLVAGLPTDDAGPGSNGGAVFVFERIAGVWTQVQKILNPDTVAGAGDGFGYSVDVVVSPDPLGDDFLIAGAPFRNSGPNGSVGDNTGTAYPVARLGEEPPTEPRPMSRSSSPVRSSKRARAYLRYAESAAEEPVPIILGCGNRNVELLEYFLEMGKFEFVSFARPLVREPDLPNRWLAGRGPADADCISCNLCFGNLRTMEPVHLHSTGASATEEGIAGDARIRRFR